MKWRNLFLFCMLSLLLSCNQDVQTHTDEMSNNIQSSSPQASGPQSSGPKSSGPKSPSPKSSGTLPFVTKPVASVSMKYEFVNEIIVGEFLEISLNFKVGRAVESLQVEYLIEPGLAGVTAQRLFQFDGLAAGEHKTVTLQVLPQQVGEHLIHVYATLRVAGRNQSRAFIVPVVVPSPVSSSDQPPAVQQKLQLNSSGNGMRYLPEQNVISMPAQESTD